MEELIFNLCEGVETRATETKIEAYRRENAADIARRQQRNAEEDRRLGELAGTSGAGDGETAPKDPGADPWAPRRMSADVSDLDETPGPGAGGNARERKSDGFETNPRGFGGLFGYTPGSQTAHKQQVVPVPATAAPVPMSAGKLMEGGHGRHAHHAGWNDAEDTAEGRARRDAAVARACGVDVRALARRRAWQEASQSLSCA